MWVALPAVVRTAEVILAKVVSFKEAKQFTHESTEPPLYSSMPQHMHSPPQTCVFPSTDLSVRSLSHSLPTGSYLYPAKIFLLKAPCPILRFGNREWLRRYSQSSTLEQHVDYS